MQALETDDPLSIGDFRLRIRLGDGGMGRVYLGLSPAGRAVAIKVLHPELARDAEFLRRFRLEIAAARAVSGMYTAPVVATGLNDRPPWLATAFVAGPSLQQVVRSRGPLPGPALWPLFAGLVEALQAIHASGVVHRDLKPSNVLLAIDGPRVIDFGICRATDGTGLTATGLVFGSPGYMSPEQAEGLPITPAADVFSLGCLIAYAARGAAPFGEGNAASVLYRIVHENPALDALPLRLRKIVAHCLQKSPAARPGLGHLAGSIAREINGTGKTALSFWPQSVAEHIEQYRATVEATLEGRLRSSTPQPTDGTPTANNPAPRTPGPRTPAPGTPALGTPAPSTPAPSSPERGDRAASSPATSNPAVGSPGASSPATSNPGAGSPGAGSPGAGSPGANSGSPGARTSAARNLADCDDGTTDPRKTLTLRTPEDLAADSAARRALVRRRVPGTVLGGARLMYAGAVYALFFAVYARLIAVTHDGHHLIIWPGHWIIRSAQGLTIVTGIDASVQVTLWLWMALACKNGWKWARIASTLLLVCYTAGVLYALARHTHDGIDRLGTALFTVTWVIGAAAVALLWRRQSTRFFKARPRAS
jgi:serine/threonine protein kinase